MAALGKVKAKVQREIRAIKDKRWNNKAKELQDMAEKHDLHRLYNGLKAIYGPKTSAVGPVLSADGCQLYTNLEDTKARWKEHFASACHKIQQRESREELSDPITDNELVKALKTTKGGKATVKIAFLQSCGNMEDYG